MIAIGLSSHGVGGPGDLPVPLMYSVVGASWALTLSFVVLILAWREPKFDSEPDAMSDRPRRPWLAVLGVVGFAWLAYVLYAGPSDASNAGLRAVYIYVWVGLVPLALIAGDVWRDLSPWRTVQGLVGRLVGRPDGWISYPQRLGYWPAAIGIFSFVWMELASPDPSSTTIVRTWVAAYAASAIAGGVVFGPRWFDRGDPLDVYSSLMARLGRWRIAATPAAPGLVAFLATLVGSTAFDSFSGTAYWQSTERPVPTATLWLLGFCVAVGVLFTLAAMATGGVDRAERRQLPQLYAHSLIPIAGGYILAHYLTLLLNVLARYPTPLAALKVTFVVAGHLLAVMAAHDCALRVLPREHRTTGQLAMLLLMVCITYTGLFLLLS